MNSHSTKPLILSFNVMYFVLSFSVYFDIYWSVEVYPYFIEKKSLATTNEWRKYKINVTRLLFHASSVLIADKKYCIVQDCVAGLLCSSQHFTNPCFL